MSIASNFLVFFSFFPAAALQVRPEAAATAIAESRALCRAVQPFIEALDGQEKLLKDASQLQTADRAVRASSASVVH